MSRPNRTLIGSRLGLLFGSVAAVWLLSVSARAQVSEASGLQASSAPDVDIPPGEASRTLRARCLGCHGVDLIRQQRLSSGGWERELEKMISWGAAVEDGDKRALVDYLSVHFSPDRSSRATPGDAGGSTAALLETKCQICHDLQLIEAQRLDVSGWAREVDKMSNWGARASASERDLLVQYLAKRFAP